MRAALTPVEEQVYQFLLDYLAEHTFQPSVRDISKQLRIPSTKSVTDLLASLERKGYVEREPGRSRGVRLTGFTSLGGALPVPVRGTDGIDDTAYLTLDRALVGSADAFIVRAGADAPVALGVLPGDYVVVQPSARARDGDLAVVRVGSAQVIGAVRHHGSALQVVSGSPGGTRTLVAQDDFEVMGVVGAVFRAVRGAVADA